MLEKEHLELTQIHYVLAPELFSILIKSNKNNLIDQASMLPSNCPSNLHKNRSKQPIHFRV